MQAKDFVKSYFDAWNHCDPKGIADHLSLNGVYRDIPEDAPMSRDELIVSLNDFFASFQHRYELVGDIQSSKNTIAFQYRMLNLDDGLKTRKEISCRGAEFITLHGDAALTITDYYELPVKIQTDKYARSGLSSHEIERIKQKLDLVIKSREVYLMPDLTLPQLAGEVGCSVNHLSQVINAGFGTSFFDYLNGYRIAHAQRLLARSDAHNHAVLNVAYEAGFNSNSAFYSAFKKFVGQTPAHFRRSIRKDA